MIREIDPQNEREILLVAERMRATLVEVRGRERGEAMYTMTWLVARVRWHLDPARTGKVLVSMDDDIITGHAIARIERGDDAQPYGYFSTIFVEPEHRRRGIAATLMDHVERWFVELGMPKSVYNTATDNERLLRLFRAHGYVVTAEASEMVQLTKRLG